MINLVSDIVYEQGDKIKDFEMKERKVKLIINLLNTIKGSEEIPHCFEEINV